MGWGHSSIGGGAWRRAAGSYTYTKTTICMCTLACTIDSLSCLHDAEGHVAAAGPGREQPARDLTDNHGGNTYDNKLTYIPKLDSTRAKPRLVRKHSIDKLVNLRQALAEARHRTIAIDHKVPLDNLECRICTGVDCATHCRDKIRET